MKFPHIADDATTILACHRVMQKECLQSNEIRNDVTEYLKLRE